MFFLVRRRRLIFGGDLRIKRCFLVFPAPSCLRKYFFLTLAATDLIYFFPVKTFPMSGAAISIKSAPTLFAAGTTYRLKKGIAIFPIVCAKASNPVPFVWHIRKITVNHYQHPFFTVFIPKSGFQKFFQTLVLL